MCSNFLVVHSRSSTLSFFKKFKKIATPQKPVSKLSKEKVCCIFKRRSKYEIIWLRLWAIYPKVVFWSLTFAQNFLEISVFGLWITPMMTSCVCFCRFIRHVVPNEALLESSSMAMKNYLLIQMRKFSEQHWNISTLLNVLNDLVS